MADERYDVIVIGAGLAGLMTAALAARRGLHPVLLEQGEAPGGACAGVQRGGYRFDGIAGLLWGAEEGGGLRGVLAEAGVSVEAVPVDPGIQVALPGHRLGFHRADERFWREVRREFSAGEAAARHLFADLDSVDAALRDLKLPPDDLPPRGPWRRFQRWRCRTPDEEALLARAGEALEAVPEWRELPGEARRALALVLRHLGHAVPSSPAPLAARLLGRARRGAAALRGGLGTLVPALVRALERHGGTLRPGTAAAAILLRGRRAAGVRTADGAVLEAPAVVAAVPPTVLGGRLLPEGHRAFPADPPAPGPATLTLYLGVDEALLPAELGPWVFLEPPGGPDPGGVETLAISTSPAWDGDRAPRGRRALTVTALLSREAGDPAARDWMQVGERVLALADDFLPGLRSRLDYCEVRSPTAWQGQTGRPLGALGYAPGSLPVFLGWQGFPHATPVPRLFAAGDWTFPGGGVADVAEGARRTVELLVAARR